MHLLQNVKLYLVFLKRCNPFPLKKLNEYVIWKEKKRIPSVTVCIYHGPQFLIRYLNVLCVPCQELVRLTCGTPPGNSVLTVTCPVVDRSQQKSCLVLSHLVSGRTDTNGYIPDTYRMSNAREPDKPHTNAQVTFIHRTSLSGGVRSKF